MSKGIDERVVSMKFDNRGFESGIKGTLTALDKLKQGLQFGKATKELSDLDRAGKSFSMQGISNSVEGLSQKFSAMGIVGITVLQNLTTAVMSSAKQIANAAILDPIRQGFAEYETQINAVQTIMANTASKGTTLVEVGAALDELNTYADKTIYNFTEMTRNIGTFTAAGVGLKESTAAIKGIANLAAVSGSNAQQASTAMYQLSQAMASGTVKLMDWNSVVNAGMGGQVFQDALKETARVNGISIDDMIAKQGSFRETLQEGWLTTSILTQTLEKFTGDLNEEQLRSIGYSEEQIAGIIELGKMSNDAATKVKTFTQLIETLNEANQSGWTKTWEILLGDFEEAKSFFTEISDTIGPMIEASAEVRNNLLQGWKDLGGRAMVIDTLRSAFQGILSIAKPIGEAFREIFPPITAQHLMAFTEGLKRLADRLTLSESTADKFKRTFKGVFAVLSIGVQAVQGVLGFLGDLFTRISPLGGVLLAVTAKLGDFLVKLDEGIKAGGGFKSIFDTIIEALDAVKKYLSPVIASLLEFGQTVVSVIDGIANADTSGVGSFFERLKIRFEPLGELGHRLKDIFKGVSKAIQKAFPEIVDGVQRMQDAISDLRIGERLGEAFKNINFDTVTDAFNSGMVAVLLLAIRGFINGLSDTISSGGGILKDLGGILDGVRGSLEAMQASLKADTLLKIAGAIGILALALLVLSTIDSDKMTVALTGMTVLFAELFGAMGIFEKFLSAGSFVKMPFAAAAMVIIAGALVILASAVKMLSELSWNELAKGLVGVTVLLGALAGSMKLMSGNVKGFSKGAAGIVLMAVAIKILASAVKDLSALSWAELAKGLLGVGAVLGALALFTRIADVSGMGASKGVGILLMAAAIKVLASAVGEFGDLSVENLIKGIAAMGVVLLEVALFTRLTGNAEHVLGTAVALTIIAGAMKIFAVVLADLGQLSWEEIAKGLTAMAGALAAVVLAMNLLPKDMASRSIGLLIAAAAILAISDAVKSFGGMSWEEIGKGLLTLAGSLLIIAGAMNLMTTALPGAAALMVVAIALTVLAPVLTTFGNMDLASIGKALLVLAGVFAVFGLAGLVLAPVAPVLLILGAALLMVGAAALAVGAGLMLFSAGLAALAVSGTVGAAALVGIVTAIAGLIPVILEQVGIGILAFASVIATGGEAITAALVTVLMSLITAINTVSPAILTTLIGLLMMMVRALVTYVPQLVDAGMQLLIGLLTGIRDNIFRITSLVLEIITEFLNAIAANIRSIVKAGANILVEFLNGLADEIPRIADAATNVITAFIDAVASQASRLADAGMAALVKFIRGLTSSVDRYSGELRSAGRDLAAALVDGMTGGLLGMVGKVASAARELGNRAVGAAKEALGVASPSKAFAEVGRFAGEGFALGIEQNSELGAKEAAAMGALAIVAMKKAMASVNDVVASDMDIAPTIRPVLDLTDVQRGARGINGLLSGGINVGNDYAQATRIAQGMAKASTFEPVITPPAPSVTNLQYTQNNYSPKALSRADIYRNTKNQLSTVKEVFK